MKKFLSVFLAAAVCILTASDLFPARAADIVTFEDGGITVTIDLDSGALTVSGKGAMKNYTSSDAAPWYTYKNKVTSVTVSPGVTSVGDYSFYSSVYLLTASLPDGLEYVGSYAFCACSRLEAISIPDSVKDIGSYAFSGCRQLKSAKLPKKLENGIPEGLFATSSYLAEVEMPTVCPIIYAYAFNGCAYLESIKLPVGLEVIKNNAFGSCAALTSVNFPSTLKYIGTRAFYGTNLTNPFFPKSLEYIGDSAFENSPWYKSLPDGVNLVNGITLTYKGTPTGKTLVIPDGARIVSPMTFGSLSFATEVVIPDTVEVICDHAFYDLSSVYSVDIPDSVKEIGEYAFGYVKSRYGEAEAPLMPFTLCGHGGGAAQQYAVNNGFEFICDHEDGAYLSYPDCTKGGEAIVACKWCGEALSRQVLRRSSHSYGTAVYERAAGCTEGALTWQECTMCKNVKILSEGEPLGHTLSESYTIDRAPTCTEDGALSRSCTRCGEKCEVIVVEKTGHKPTGDAVTVKEPTCTEAGLRVVYCGVCREAAEEEEIPAAGHSYSGDWKILTPPAPYSGKEGLRVIDCSKCGMVAEYEYYLAGDLNANGIIDGKDSLIFKMLMDGEMNYDQPGIVARNGDMNSDCMINAFDLMIFTRIIMR